MKTRKLMLGALCVAFMWVLSGCTGLEPYAIDAPDDLAEKIAAYKAEKEAQNVVPDDAVPIEISPAVVGQTDNNSAWWTDFSQYFTIPVAKKLVLKFKNNSLGEANYQNWVLGVTNAKERGADGYSGNGLILCCAPPEAAQQKTASANAPNFISFIVAFMCCIVRIIAFTPFGSTPFRQIPMAAGRDSRVVGLNNRLSLMKTRIYNERNLAKQFLQMGVCAFHSNLDSNRHFHNGALHRNLCEWYQIVTVISRELQTRERYLRLRNKSSPSLLNDKLYRPVRPFQSIIDFFTSGVVKQRFILCICRKEDIIVIGQIWHERVERTCPSAINLEIWINRLRTEGLAPDIMAIIYVVG